MRKISRKTLDFESATEVNTSVRRYTTNTDRSLSYCVKCFHFDPGVFFASQP